VHDLKQDTFSASRDDERTSEFVRLLTRHERRVYAYILSLVPNWADADELLQETNVRLWKQFDKYQPGTDFGAWACTIAYYQVLTYRKRQGREKVRFSQAFVDAVAEEIEAAAPQANERHRALAVCIEKLNDSQRSLVRMCYDGGHTVKDAAKELGQSAAAAYKSLQRVRKALQQCIQQNMDEEQEPA